MLLVQCLEARRKMGGCSRETDSFANANQILGTRESRRHFGHIEFCSRRLIALACDLSLFY